MNNYLLNVKSVYNFLSSTITIADYVRFGQKHHFSALSLIDNKVMYCYPEFYFACCQANIKPIFGLEFVVKYEQLLINVVLIAQNYAGYNNLVKISSLLNTQQEA